MKRSVPVAVLMAALMIPALLAAQESAAAKYAAVLGQWESTIETPRGAFTQTFSFSLDGDKLVGTVSGRGGETALKNVKLEEGTLTFEIERNFAGNTMVQSVTATIAGSEMNGTQSGGRGGDRPFKAAKKAT